MDPFASLGLPYRFELDQNELEHRYRDLQRQLHPDRHKHATASQRRMALLRAMEVNEAYRALRKEQTRAEALLKYHGVSTAGGDPADPEFLMEIMELREGLGDARAARDLSRVKAMAGEVESQRQRCLAELSSGFAAIGEAPDATQAAALQGPLARLRYYGRFLEEVRAIEDDLD